MGKLEAENTQLKAELEDKTQLEEVQVKKEAEWLVRQLETVS